MTDNQPQPAAVPTQQAQQPIIIDATPAPENQKINEAETEEFLKEIQENAGQIAELLSEEGNLVTQFFSSLFRILKPFGRTLEISPNSLPQSYVGRVNKACLHLSGQLALVYTNGEVEILNLTDQENHDVLVGISREILMGLKTVVNSFKSKTEQKVKFLMSITKELQKIAEVFTEK